MKSNDSGSSIAITFLIGNGFDLALGLKTGYSDFLKWYKDKKEKASDTFQTVKWLVKRIQSDPDLWADAEAAWGTLPYSEAQKEDRDLTPQKIIDEAIGDFQRELIAYLERESKRLVIDNTARHEVRDKFLKALVNSLQLVKNGPLKQAIEKDCGLEIRFVTFNVTKSIETLFGRCLPTRPIPVPIGKTKSKVSVRIDSICHVHGCLGDNGSMIFGLDNADQIKDAEAQKYCKQTGTLIKSQTDKQASLGFEEEGKKAIDAAQWIVCYGLSFGATDFLWWDYLRKRLSKGVARLILHPHFRDVRDPLSALEKSRIVRDVGMKFVRAAFDDKLNGSSDEKQNARRWNKLKTKVYVADHCSCPDVDGGSPHYCNPLCLIWFKKRYVLSDTDSNNATDEINDDIMRAKSDNASACFRLGVRYHLGFGVSVDKKKAVEWYMKAANKGHVEATFNLGLCYYNGTGVEKDEREAVKLWQKAANKGNTKAKTNLGVCYAKGEGVEMDKCRAVEWYRKAAEKDHAEAMFYLGVCYAKGEGVEMDKCRAVEWWQKAANKGHAKAMANLGWCYERGTGVAKDAREAVKWYQKAADKDLAEAMFNLGVCCANGTGVEKDEHKAVMWYLKAADKNHTGAMANLGLCYYNGTGVEKDEREAVKWYQKAADKGDTDAMFNLGWCYYQGTGVAKNEQKAVEWYQKARTRALRR